MVCGALKAHQRHSDGKQYADALIEELAELWRKVLERRAPQVCLWLDRSPHAPIPRSDDASPYLQAFTIWFQLLRIIEENATVRARRQIETENGASAVPGSIANALTATGMSVDAFARLAGNFSVGPTLTAHPTEAKRVTVLQIHRRIYRLLVALETQRWTPRERQQILDDIQGEIDLLWLTGELRLERPSLKDEIEWGLQFFHNSIFEAVPQVFERFQHALNDAFDSAVPVPDCIRVHSWIGGDRDGNPGVTAEMTTLALARARESIIGIYQAALESAASRLSISDHILPPPAPYRARLQSLIDRGRPVRRNPNEIFRQAVSAIARQLKDGMYPHIGSFIADIDTVYDALCAIDASSLANRYLRPLRWQATVFGFRTMTLDIRQNSTVTTSALTEIWRQEPTDVPAYGSSEWSTRVRRELALAELPHPDTATLSPATTELLELLQLMRSVRHSPDPQAIGPFILSMTRSADDMLGVYLLARYAGFGAESLDIAVVPLFETIEDLRRAPDTLMAVLDVPLARRSLKVPARAMEIMLGYSDSNKDGGFVCSIRELDKAQRKMVRALQSRGYRAEFFHGRGGSVSRGGAPTERAIAAQPAGTVAGRLRITDQGEVVSAKYANRGTATDYMELLLASTLRHCTAGKVVSVCPEFEDTLDALAGLSQSAYRSLLDTPGFVQYFQQASPVEELARLKIGSRPSRRFGATTLEDLRAIPWVFAWSQNRHLITGWYGFGTAIDSFRRVRGTEGEQTLRHMFGQSNLFRLIVDEVEKSLLQCDLDIAAQYATLVTDAAASDAVYGKIRAEYERSRIGIRLVTGHHRLGERFPEFCTRFNRTRHELDRINALQVVLLRESRSAANTGSVSVPLLQSMNSIATALGWTG